MFVNDADYANTKDLANRTVWEKFLKVRVWKIALNPKYDGYQRDLASMALLIRKQDQEQKQT